MERHVIPRSLLAAVAAALLLGTPAMAAPAIVVAPLASPAGRIDYPRVTRFANAAVRKRVNATLAAREAAVRSQRADCLAMVRKAGQTPTADSFRAKIAAHYVSGRYLSIEAHLSYFCATAYPTNDAAEPLTFDLSTGAEVDWSKLFKPGFLPSSDAQPASGLSKLYQAHYARARLDPDLDQPCKDAIEGSDPLAGGVSLWLDAKRGGLVVMPSFPHVIEACAAPLIFTPAELAPDVADAGFLRDLKATAARR
jgi:hypothetical protein